MDFWHYRDLVLSKSDSDEAEAQRTPTSPPAPPKVSIPDGQEPLKTPAKRKRKEPAA